MSPALGAETPGAVVEVPREVTVSQDLYVRQTSGLVRTVGPRTALLANLVAMGIVVNWFWVVFASAGYPHADLTLTVAFGVLINIGIGFVYWMLSSAMPRSGGDYVYLSRIFHPSLGFATNLLITVIFITWAGLFPFYFAWFGLPMMLAAFGIVANNGGALTWAGTLSSTTSGYSMTLGSMHFVLSYDFLIGALILALVILISLLPTRWIFRTSVGIFVISAIIYVVMLAVLIATPQSTFVHDWNTNPNIASQSCPGGSGSFTYDCVLGLFPPSALAIAGSGVFFGVVYTMLSFIGYANTAYFGSEVRGNPLRTQGLAIFGAPLIFAALIAILYAATYYTFGHNFLVALSSTCVTPGAPCPTAAIPSPLFLVAYIVGNPFLAAFLAFGIPLTFFGFSLIYFVVPTRNLFAWSFDRILPAGVARVTRNGVPWVAVLILAVGAYICLWIAAYTTLFSFLIYANFGFWFAMGIVCFGGAAFPFLKPALFASAPSIVRARVGRVPVLTIVGVASGLASWWVSYASTVPAFTEAAPIFTPQSIETMLGVFVVGLIVYFVAWAIQRARAVPLDLINKELPPE
jgi:amino acid transporter